MRRHIWIVLLLILYFLLIGLFIFAVRHVHAQDTPTGHTYTAVHLDPQPDGWIKLTPYVAPSFRATVINGTPTTGSAVCYVHDYTLECGTVTLRVDSVIWSVN